MYEWTLESESWPRDRKKEGVRTVAKIGAVQDSWLNVQDRMFKTIKINQIERSKKERLDCRMVYFTDRCTPKGCISVSAPRIG